MTASARALQALEALWRALRSDVTPLTRRQADLYNTAEKSRVHLNSSVADGLCVPGGPWKKLITARFVEPKMS